MRRWSRLIRRDPRPMYELHLYMRSDNVVVVGGVSDARVEYTGGHMVRVEIQHLSDQGVGERRVLMLDNLAVEAVVTRKVR